MRMAFRMMMVSHLKWCTWDKGFYCNFHPTITKLLHLSEFR